MLNFNTTTINDLEKLPVMPGEFLCIGDTRKNNTVLPFLIYSGHTDAQQSALCLLISQKTYQDLETYNYDISAQFTHYAKGYSLNTHTAIASDELLVRVKDNLTNGATVKKEEEKIDQQALISRFNRLMENAMKLNASDVHIDASDNGDAKVRFRIYKVLHKFETMTYQEACNIIASIYNQKAAQTSKDYAFSVLSSHKTTIKRKLLGKPYNLRFASKPTYPQGSFSVVMRLLALLTDVADVPTIESLGYSPTQVRLFENSTKRAGGLDVVSGVVNSGKSTTLQSLITRMLCNNPGNKAYTFENPVEYVIPGAEQIEITQRQNETLSSFQARLGKEASDLLQMDLNYLLVGEITTSVVAQVVQRMVQSGHKVATTVHAASGLHTFSRLVGLGLDPDVISQPGFFSTMTCQGLVKVPCTHCAQSLDLPEHSEYKERALAEVNRFGLDKSILQNVRIAQAGNTPCAHCNDLGVTGLSVIAEVIRPNQEILQALKNNKIMDAYRAWRVSGAMTIQEHGLLKALKGEVCFKDVAEVLKDMESDSDFLAIDQSIESTDFKQAWELHNA